MKIKLGIVTLEIKFKVLWNVGTESKIVKVLKEKGEVPAVIYYRNELNNRDVGLKDSMNYIKSLAAKYEITN